MAHEAMTACTHDPTAEFAHSPGFSGAAAELERSGSDVICARPSCQRKRERPRRVIRQPGSRMARS